MAHLTSPYPPHHRQCTLGSLPIPDTQVGEEPPGQRTDLVMEVLGERYVVADPLAEEHADRYAIASHEAGHRSWPRVLSRAASSTRRSTEHSNCSRKHDGQTRPERWRARGSMPRRESGRLDGLRSLSSHSSPRTR